VAAVPRSATGRLGGIDALRGIAILAMIAYHFAFDLRLFGWTASDFERDPFWLVSRAAIVSTFLALAGVSLVLADRAGVPRAGRWRRLARIAACAVAVSAASAVMFPQRFIYFGILHAIVVASVLAQPFVRRPRLALAAGLAIIVAGVTVASPVFDPRALSWIGFNATRPPTEDFVPLFPWLGVVLLGVAAGNVLVQRSFAPVAPLAVAPAWLRWLGRHSLAVYMVHQPVLIGLLWLVARR
jgi:uncharacterized membrane protein